LFFRFPQMQLKLFFKNSIRRVDYSDSKPTYLGLREFLERTYQLHLGFSIKYKDDEGDLCTISVRSRDDNITSCFRPTLRSKNAYVSIQMF